MERGELKNDKYQIQGINQRDANQEMCRQAVITPLKDSIESYEVIETGGDVEEINALHRAGVNCLNAHFFASLRIGELLSRKKIALAHSEFMPWVKKNLVFSHRTATRYMSVYKHYYGLKLASVSNLNKAYNFIKLLTHPESESKGEGDEKSYRFTVVMDEPAKDIILTVIDDVKAMFNTDSNCKALMHIAYEYYMSQENPLKLIPPEMAKMVFEETYGVKITIHDDTKAQDQQLTEI